MRILLSPFVLLFLLTAPFNSFGETVMRLDNFSDLTAAQIKQIRKSTLVFIIRDDMDVDSVKSVFSDVWKASPFEIVKYSEFGINSLETSKTYLRFDYSYALDSLLHGYFFHSDSPILNFYMHDPSVDVDDKDLSKKFRRSWVSFGEISLEPSFREAPGTPKGHLFEHGLRKNLYTDMKFRNIGLGYLKNELGKMSSYLIAGKVESTSSNGVELAQLKKNTLYVPNHILISNWLFSRNGLKFNKEEDVFADYEFEYELINPQKLSNMILNSERPLYYVEILHRGESVTMNIINSSTGKVIARQHKSSYPEFKNKDLKKLSKSIAKS